MNPTSWVALEVHRVTCHGKHENSCLQCSLCEPQKGEDGIHAGFGDSTGKTFMRHLGALKVMRRVKKEETDEEEEERRIRGQDVSDKIKGFVKGRCRRRGFVCG